MLIDKICWDNIGEANGLLFDEVETLSIGVFKKWLRVNAKLVKSGGVMAICIVVCLNLIIRYNRGVMNVDIL